MGGKFRVTVKFDKAFVKASISANCDEAIAAVANEALKDANFYARIDTGATVKSSIMASEPENGRLVWNTPYARKVYYAGKPSLESNPHASLLWAHRGFTENQERYIKMLQAVAAKRRPGFRG